MQLVIRVLGIMTHPLTQFISEPALAVYYGCIVLKSNLKHFGTAFQNTITLLNFKYHILHTGN